MTEKDRPGYVEGQGPWVEKGSKVRIDRFVAKPMGTYSLAGAQMKVSATREEFTGTVRKVWGDAPTNPKRIWFLVEKEDGTTAEVEAHHIVAVLT